MILLIAYFIATVLGLRSLGTVPNTNFSLGWQFQKDFIEVEIKLKTQTYAPLLLGTTMTNKDLWFCSKEDSETEWSMKDYFSTGWAMPKNDAAIGGTNDVYDVKITTDDDGITCYFKRKLDTGDTYDQVLERGKSLKVCSFSATTVNFHKHASKEVRYCFYWPLVDGYQGQLLAEQQKSNLTLVHGIILTICWGFLMDIAIMIVRLMRTVKNYKIAHAIFFFVINLASLPFIILMLVKQRINIFHNFEFMDTINQIHFINGFIIMILIVIEHGIGITTKFIQQNPDSEPRKFVTVRLFHQLIGYLLFIMTKVQILIGWWAYGAKAKLVLSILLVWFVALIAVRALLTELFYKGKLGKFLNFFSKQKYNDGSSSETLLLSDDADDSIDLMRAIDAKKSREAIQEDFADSKYFFFRDKVCLLKNFDHPGGAALIKQSVGLDITKYIYGGMPLEGSKSKANQHSSYAISILESSTIGTHIKSQIVIDDPSDWSIKTLEELTPNIFKFNFSNPTFQISTNPQEYDDYIGHYVLVTTENATRTYTLVLSEIETNIKYRDLLLLLCSNEFKNVPFEIQPEPKTNELPLIIKKYDRGTVSQDVHYRKKLKSITGIYGLGLNIQPGLNVIITGGTGILPFLDLFDLLLKKAIFSVANKLNIQNTDTYNLYKINYLNAYPNSKFVLYSSFKQLQQFSHFKWLNSLHQISDHYNLGLFEMHIKDHSYKSLKTFSGRIDEMFFEKRFAENVFARLFICGPPSMNDDILDILRERKYDSSKYLIM